MTTPTTDKAKIEFDPPKPEDIMRWRVVLPAVRTVRGRYYDKKTLVTGYGPPPSMSLAEGLRVEIDTQ